MNPLILAAATQLLGQLSKLFELANNSEGLDRKQIQSEIDSITKWADDASKRNWDIVRKGKKNVAVR